MNSRNLDVQSHFIHSHSKNNNPSGGKGVRPKELDINNRTNNGSSFSFNKDNDGETNNSIIRGGARNLALIDPSPVHKNYKRSSSKQDMNFLQYN